MNIAIVFAGGTGQRMNTKTRPKQFLELHGKPILVYTLEQFQQHNEIDHIILVSIQDWLDYCFDLAEKYHLSKICAIIPGGNTGQQSIYKGLGKAAEQFSGDSIVLIHDGVRPLIDEETITKDLECVRKHGSAVTVSPAIETIALKGEEGKVGQIIDRSQCQLAKAPQCFYLKDILDAHYRAQVDGGKEFVDSACLMQNMVINCILLRERQRILKLRLPGTFIFLERSLMQERIYKYWVYENL